VAARKTQKSYSLEQQAFIATLRTASQMEWRLAEMLKPHGLSPTQYNALRILRGACNEGLPCREIGERMINRDPDITRLLDRLERRALVQRCREPSDRRIIKARISTSGLDLLQKLDRKIDHFHRQLLGRMGRQNLASLTRLLSLAGKSRT
jgi:DNA-binding MarR family transcriptional regulator